MSIKLLKKITPPKVSMREHITHYCIKDNIINVTDLETTVKMPIDHDNGIYDIKNDLLIKNNDLLVEDFPEAPDKAGLQLKCNIKISDMIMVNKVCSSEMKFNLSGFCIDIKNKKIVATDGNRLILYDIEIDDIKESALSMNKVDNSIIVNLKFIDKLLNHYKNESITEIVINKKNLFFKINDIEISTRLIGQNFPNYEAVMPEKYKYKIDFSLLLQTNFNKIKMTGNNNSIRLVNNSDTNKLTFLFYEFEGNNRWNKTEKDAINKYIIETDIDIDFDLDIYLNKKFIEFGISVNPIFGFNTNDSSIGNDNYVIMPLNM